MAQKDSQLVIRARDEASKALQTITKAVSEFETAQSSLAGSGAAASSTLGKLASSVKELGVAAGALTGVEKIAGQMTRAEKAVGSLEAKLSTATADLATYGARLEEAASKNGALQQEAASASTAVERQAKAVSTLAAEQRKLATAEKQAQAAAAAANARVAKTPNDPTLLTRKAESDAKAARAQAALAEKNAALEKERAALAALQAAREPLVKQAADAARVEQSFKGSVDAAKASVANLTAGLGPAKAGLAEIKAIFEEGARAAGLETASVEALTRAQKSLQAAAVSAGNALAAEQARQKAAAAPGGRPGAAGTSAGQPATSSPAAAAVTAYKEYAQAKTALESMYRAMSEAGKATPEMTAAINVQRAAVDAASASYQRAKAALDPLKESIRAAAAGRVAAQKALEDATANSIAQAGAKQAEAGRAAAAAAAAAQVRAISLAEAERVAAESALAMAAAETKAAAAIRVEEAALTPLVRMLNAYREAVSAASANTQAATKSHEGFGASLRNLAGAYLTVFTAINTFRAVVDASVNAEAAQVRIATALGQGMEAGAAAYQHAANAARQLRLDILPTVDAYGQFMAVTKDTAIEGEKSRQIFDNLLITMRAFKLSPEAMERATLALKDMAAKGTIARREINQLDLAMPVGTLQAMAQAAGYGAGQLQEFSKAVHAGQIGLDVLPKTFEIIAERAKKGLPDALNTAQSALANLRNSIFDLSVAVGQGQFMEGLVSGANALSAALKSDDTIKALREIATGFGELMKGMAAALPFAKQIIEALTALAAIKIVGWAVGFEGLATAVGGALTGVRALVTGFAAAEAGAAGLALTAEGVGAALAAIVGFLTGPVGIALAVGAIGAGLAAWAMNTSHAEDALRDYQTTMDRVKGALTNNGGDLSKVGQGIGDPNVGEVEATVVKQRAALLSAKQSLAEYVAGLGNGIGMVDAFGNAMDGAADEQVQALKKIAQAYADGKISGDQFRTSVSEMQRTLTSPDAQAIAENLLKQSQGVKTLTDNTADAATAAKGMGSKLEGLDGDIKKGTSSINDFAKGIRESASDMSGAAVKAATDYETALGKIESMIPGLKEKLKDLKDAADISANLKKGMDAIDAASAAGMDDRDADRKRRRLQGATDDAKTATDGTTVAVASALVEHLMQKYGLNRDAAVGAVGVMGYESGNFQHLQQQMTPEQTARGERGGYGYTQSTGPRRSDEDAFFAAHPDLDPSSLEGQTRWFDEEASGKYSGAMNKLKGEDTVEGGAKSFLRNFEGMVDTGADVNPDGGVPATAQHVARAEQYSRILPDSSKKDAAGQMADVNKKEKDAEADRQADADAEAHAQKDIQSEKDLAALAEAKTKAAKEYDDFKKAHPEASTQELAAAKVKADAGVREIEVAKEVDAYRERNKSATADEVAQYRSLVAARVAAADQEKAASSGEVGAKHDVIEGEKQLNALITERSHLIEQMNKQGKTGLGATESEKAKLADLTKQVDDLIAKLRQMYAALGGADSVAGLARLDAVSADMTKAANQAHLFGLSMEDTKKVANDFANDLASAFDNFAKKIADGEKPLQALREAFLQMASEFLQQIAKMIIQQAIFNALGMNKQGDLTGGGLLGSMTGGTGASAAGSTGIMSSLTKMLTGGGGTPAVAGAATGAGGLSPDTLAYLSSHAGKGIDVAHLNPEFAGKLEGMMKSADAEGISTHIASGARSEATQNELYQNMLAKKEGRPAPFPGQSSPAVAAAPGSSYHEFGNASDVYASNPAQQARLDALAKQQGLVPGTSFGDQGHFQIAGPKNQGLYPNGIGVDPTQAAQKLQQSTAQATQNLTSLTTKVSDLGTKSVAAVPDLTSVGTSLTSVATDATKAAGSSTGGGGGLGSLLQMLMGFIPKHGGGLVGSGSSAGRQVSPLAFVGASRYHNGGIVGLGANEVPIIAQKNEEVLTASDPRHSGNGGGLAMRGQAPPSVKVVNAFDPASFMTHGLSTTQGETAMMNFVRSNAGAIKGALG